MDTGISLKVAPDDSALLDKYPKSSKTAVQDINSIAEKEDKILQVVTEVDAVVCLSDISSLPFQVCSPYPVCDLSRTIGSLRT